MPAGKRSDETTRQLLIPVLVLLLTVTVLLSAVATVPLVGSANAETPNDAGGDTFASFNVSFDPSEPEEPNDVQIRWNLSDDADHVEKVRIAITNETGSPINLFRPAGEDVPNSFTVSAGDDSERADITVHNLSAVTLELKIPPGHCGRVEAVEVTALDGSNDTITEPNIERAESCTSTTDAGAFEITIDEYDREVSAGEDVTVTADVENTGTAEATQDIRFLVDGDELETTTLTLAADQNETVTFRYETNESDVGEHEIAVEAEYTDGSTRPVTDNATLTANDTTVATVTTDGTVTAESEGQTLIEAVFEGEIDTETLTVVASDTDDSASDDSSAEENSTSDTSAADSDFDDTDSDDTPDDEAHDDDETESDGGADSDDGTNSDDAADGNGSNIEDAADGNDSDVDDSDVDDSDVDNSAADSDGDFTVNGSDTDDVADSPTATGESDETTIAFFPILGLLLLPVLVLRTEKAAIETR